ncbi:hypothetical protein ACLBWZ_08555 [Brucellaceae bacterium C25G]
MDFLDKARSKYLAVNTGTLYWMMSRDKLQGGLLNTKQNSLTLQDYGHDDEMRGPDYTYGWIQGRGLEALATHAHFFDQELPPLAVKLDQVGKALFPLLEKFVSSDGHAYFCYDLNHNAVYPDQNNKPVRQNAAGQIFTYSDAFVSKGLMVASNRFKGQPDEAKVTYLKSVIQAIEEKRFQIDERQPLTEAAIANQPNDIGPRMILLGAAALFNRIGLHEHTAYAERFICHIIDHHYDLKTGLLRNVPDGDECNVGHGIEFVGFALDYLGPDADPALIEILEKILLSSFKAGFIKPGIALSVSVATGQATNKTCPWWSLPETIRAAALLYERRHNDEILDVWKMADQAFFDNYWLGTPPLARQTMTQQGQIDFVPATPDLDPGYHTGLSLLAALQVADRLTDHYSSSTTHKV